MRVTSDSACRTPIRIGYVVNTYPRPSQTFIRREIQALEAAGLSITRFAMRPDPQPLVTPVDKAEFAATEYVLDRGALTLGLALLRGVLRHPRAAGAAISAGLRGGKGRGLLRQLIYLAEGAWLARRCRAAGIAHLHAHFGTNSTDVARYSRLMGGPGYSMTVHGPEEFDAIGALNLEAKIADACFVVAVSDFGRSQLARWTPAADWPKLQVVHCGIDRHVFAQPRPLPPGPGPGHPLQLVSIGRFVEQKGQMMLLEAMARVRQPMHLRLVGDGPLAPAIRQTIARLGIADRVSLPGWMDEGQVAEALSQAHVMVMPSFAEGLPVALMEAMAAARPCITTYVAGIPELVLDRRTGWLVPAGSADALAAALDEAALSPPERLAEMGAAARERALARHDICDSAARLAQLFRACSEKQPLPAPGPQPVPVLSASA